MQGDTRVAVQNIDLKVRYGEVVAILEPSGGGKNLLNILGLLSMPAGATCWTVQNTATFNAAQRAEARLDSIGFVFQAFHLIEHKMCTATLSYRSSTVACPKAEQHNGLRTLSPCWGVEPPSGCTHLHLGR